MLLPHTATQRRLTASGNGSDYQTLGSIQCFIQPLDVEKSQLYSIIFTKGSVCYLPIATDLREKDRLVYNGTTYGVKGIVSRNYGNLAHKEAILQEL